MLKFEQIPDEVVKALKASTQWSSFWHGDDMKELIAAAINAWPGGVHREGSKTLQGYIILPLPQEGK